jgi:O-antigen ligase
VALVVALFIGGALRPYALAALLIVTSIGVGYYFLGATPTERARLGNLTAEGSSGRSDAWQLAWQAAREHPVLGVGMENFTEVGTRYVTSNFSIYQIRTALNNRPVPHNVYLQTLAELGVVGLAIVVVLLGSAISIGYGAIRRLAAAGDHETELLGRGILIAIVGLLSLYAFYSSLIEKELWLLLGLLTSLSVLARFADDPPPDAAEPPSPIQSRRSLTSSP